MNGGRGFAWRQILSESGLGRLFLSGDPTSLQMQAVLKHMIADARRQNVWDTSLDMIRYAVFDTETTGLDPIRDHLLSIGCVEMIGNEIKDTQFETFIKVGDDILIPHDITELTGIHRYMLKDAPPLNDALRSFLSFLGDAVLVAHHARHDVRFLNKALHHCCNMKIEHRVLDTAVIAQVVYESERPWTLDMLIQHYKVKVTDRHTAIGDARLLANVWQLLIKDCFLAGYDTIGSLLEQMVISGNASS